MSQRLPWACALLLLAGPARANLAASRPDPALLANPVGPAEPGLRVVAESLSFDCRQEGGEPVCAFEARYTFQNPAVRYVTVPAAFYSYRARDIRIVEDGTPIDRPLTAEQERDLDLRVRSLMHPGSVDPRAKDVTRSGAAISAIPEARVEVQITGTILPGRYFKATYAIPTTHARHVLLGSNPPASDHFNLDYLVAPIRTWGPAPRIRVQVTHPERWQVRLSTSAGGGGGDPAEDRLDRRSGTVTHQLVIDGQNVDVFSMGVDLPRGLQHGGLLLGLGGNVDDSGGMRGRAAWAIAGPDWLFYSLGVDSDLKRDLVVAPLLEMTTPSIFYVIPSLGAGVGVPVRLRPQIDVGGRLQFTVQWPVLGFVAWVDYYPERPWSDPGAVQISLLGQLAL